MRKLNLSLLILSCGWLFVLSGCQKSIANLFPKQPRPFQEKAFNPEKWKDGDYQTRGEMALSLYRERWNKSSANNLEKKSPTEVARLLGEPDKKTRGNCCHVRYAPEVEVWLYRIQLPDGQKNDLRERAVQIYFTEDGKTVQDLTIKEMEDKPVHIPAIG